MWGVAKAGGSSVVKPIKTQGRGGERALAKRAVSNRTATPLAAVLPDRSGFAAVEGWRGEIITWVQSGPQGGINRCTVRDPSGVNWLGLEQCIHGNIVPDFPLCNKSFNASYSGPDL